MTVAVARIHHLATLGVLVRRSIDTCLRMPALVLSPLIMSGFFLLIYDGQLSNAAAQFVPGGSYVSFLVPLVLLTTAFSGGAIAGQLMLRDLDSGYYAAMAVTPVPRSLLALAPTAAGTFAIAVQSVTLILLGWVLGLQQPHGLPNNTGISVLFYDGLIFCGGCVGTHTFFHFRDNSARGPSSRSQNH